MSKDRDMLLAVDVVAVVLVGGRAQEVDLGDLSDYKDY
jgi:hypothetical protein